MLLIPAWQGLCSSYLELEVPGTWKVARQMLDVGLRHDNIRKGSCLSVGHLLCVRYQAGNPAYIITSVISLDSHGNPATVSLLRKMKLGVASLTSAFSRCPCRCV